MTHHHHSLACRIDGRGRRGKDWPTIREEEEFQCEVRGQQSKAIGVFVIAHRN
jgi:hypothetical protein